MGNLNASIYEVAFDAKNFKWTMRIDFKGGAHTVLEISQSKAEEIIIALNFSPKTDNTNVYYSSNS